MINGKCVNLCLGDDDNLNKKETITTKYLGLIARQKWKRSKSKSIILSNHKSILENRRCLFRFFSRKFFYQSNRFFSFRMWWDRYQEKFFCFWSNKMKTKHNFYVRIFLCCFFYLPKTNDEIVCLIDEIWKTNTEWMMIIQIKLTKNKNETFFMIIIITISYP